MLCFDHSRVVLAAEDEEGHTDYVNANYVDGYKQKNAFISTQGKKYLSLYSKCIYFYFVSVPKITPPSCFNFALVFFS